MQELQSLKNSFDAAGLTVIPRDVTVTGTLNATDSEGKVHTIDVAGTLDLLAYDQEGNFYIYDMKTVRSSIDQHKEEKYARQLSLYKKFLENTYGIRVKSLNIIPIQVEYPAPKGWKDSTNEYTIDEGNQLYINGEEYKNAKPQLFRPKEVGYREPNIQYEKLTDVEKKQTLSKKKQEEYTQEMQDILAKAPRDSQGRLLAPNGKPSNLTERQYAQVRTKAFKDWFGDWEKEYTPPRKYDLSTWERTGKYVKVFGKDFLGNDYYTSEEILSHPVERKETTKEDPFGFNSTGVSRAIKVGTLVNKSNPLNGICQFTAQRIQAFLKDRYGIDAHTNIIEAKSPVTGKTITHHVAALTIDGKPYIYDMPQTEFISTNGNTFNVGNKEYKEAVITKEYAPRLIEISKDSLLKNYGDTNDTQIPVIKNTAKLSGNIKSSDIETNYIPAYSSDVSKVVDENGEPLVVYHGNKDSNITKFVPNKGKYSNKPLYYFSSSKDTALSYATEGASTTDPNDYTIVGFNVDPNTEEAKYADFKSLEDFDIATRSKGRIYEVFLNIRNPINDVSPAYIHDDSLLKGKNNDGMVSVPFSDRVNGVEDRASEDIQYVVLSSNQIKSATDNTGAFSTTNDDIYDTISKLISEKDASINQTSSEIITPTETKEVKVEEVTVADNNEPTVDLNTGLNIGKVKDRRKKRPGTKVNPKPTRLIPSRLTWGVWEGFTNEDNEPIDVKMTLKDLSKFYTEEQWNQLSDEEMEHELKCKGFFNM